jgi:hypothetical protein
MNNAKERLSLGPHLRVVDIMPMITRPYDRIVTL